MRSVVLAALAALAVGVSACGKSGPGAGAPPAPTPAEQAKALAALPAPYNTADLGNGEARFGLCKSCHTLQEGGANITGPHLFGVVGRKAGSVEGFRYSDALMASGITWTPDKLDAWITKPSALVPGTKMTFPGLSEANDRRDLIAYIMVNANSPSASDGQP